MGLVKRALLMTAARPTFLVAIRYLAAEEGKKQVSEPLHRGLQANEIDLIFLVVHLHFVSSSAVAVAKSHD